MIKIQMGKLILGNLELAGLLKKSYFDLVKIEKEVKIKLKKLRF